MPRHPKLLTAYGWWLIGGYAGFHRMYVGWTRLGGTMLAVAIALPIASLLFDIMQLHGLPLVLLALPSALIWILDLFLLPRLVSTQREKIESEFQKSAEEGDIE